MSQNTWTPCGGPSDAVALELRPWRVRESQFINSTRKLVDSNAEQLVLEELIDDRAKPKVPSWVEERGLHYLLATPFRHPPLRNGSRFGTRTERGIFYGAVEIETCLAEVAYYRFVFLSGTAADIGRLQTQHSAFQVHVRTERGIDLTAPPFSAHRASISSPVDYSVPQRLGRQMREAEIEAFVFHSARAHRRDGRCVAVMSPDAFASPKPLPAMQSWLCTVDPQKVEFRRKDLTEAVWTSFTFPLTDFLVEGKLPQPATG